MKPLRVLLISHTCQSRDEGHSKAVELGRFDDVDLQVIVPDRWLHYGKWRGVDAQLEGDFTYMPMPVRWPWMGPAQWYLHYYPGLAAVLQSFRPDVIDLWEEPYGLISAHAIRLRNRLLPTAKVIAETEQNIDKRLPPPFEWFRRYTLRHADFVVGRSAEAIEVVRRKGYRGPAESVPNAVDIARFAPMDRVACRTRYGVDGFVVGYVGRLIDWKGIDEIIGAMRLLPPDVQLLIAGEGARRADLEALAREPGMAGRVHLVGQVPGDQLASAMNAMDALLLPSRTMPNWKEQFGRVIIEAHACGVPVIGSDSGAIPDVIGEAGLIVPERDAAALANAIRQLRASPGDARRRGELGRTRAHREFTWAAVAGRMREIYHLLSLDSADRNLTSGHA